MITLIPISRRRPRTVDGPKNRQTCCKYRVRGKVDGNVTSDLEVCRTAFLSIQGIGKKRVERLVRSLQESGKSPKNKKGKYDNRPWKLPEATKDLMRDHISSFNSRNSHYGLKDSKKKYLDECLNVRKMYYLFKEKYPDVKGSYEIYRTIFATEFNIGFGYPRTDTCSYCDERKVKIKALTLEINSCVNDERKKDMEKTLRKAELEINVHLKRAEMFYTKKTNVRKACKKTKDKQALCMNYGRNLPMPNISTNDVYYKRQLSLFVFNVHILSNSDSFFYLYPETRGKRVPMTSALCFMILYITVSHKK